MIRVVANPSAGGYSADLASTIRRRCLGSTVDIVVVVGGDGTASAVAAAAGTTPLHIVPAGTANSFYRTLWGRTPWPDALDRALAGSPPVRVDLARVLELDRPVLSGASVGFSARGVELAKSSGVGYGAALAGLADSYAPFPGRVLVDGAVVHSGPTLLANVGGGRYRGWAYELLPFSRLDDGLLHVCVLDGSLDAREMLALTRTGEHVGRPGVVYARGRRIRLERTDGRPLHFEHDGEVPAEPRSVVTQESLPGAIRMIAG